MIASTVSKRFDTDSGNPWIVGLYGGCDRKPSTGRRRNGGRFEVFWKGEAIR